MYSPFISICIPAYKNATLLEKLLQSVAVQSFKDFEIIITDDTPNDEVLHIAEKYKATFQAFSYFKNHTSLGSPENWNEAIGKAAGKWIKIMHHDDFFLHENALSTFAEYAEKYGDDHSFIFSGFQEFKDNSPAKSYLISPENKKLLEHSPLNLFKYNFIGPPSTTLIKNNGEIKYDKNVKWVVDFEFYIRYLAAEKFVAIPETLIGIGIHGQQITQQVFRKREVELPENFYLINKIGADKALKNIYAYDYCWRSFRNLHIRSTDEIYEYIRKDEMPRKLKKMLAFQLKIPMRLLQNGFLSKCFMGLSYLLNRQ